MKDAYVDVFRTVVKETQSETGYELPEALEAYVVMLLASKVDAVELLPKQGFGKTYLTLTQSSKQNAKELGDTCLFVTGVFPKYGSKYNINQSYYVNIGISSYELAARTLNYNTFYLLAKHFEFLRLFIETATSSKKIERLF
jgi:hypothetical protein